MKRLIIATLITIVCVTSIVLAQNEDNTLYLMPKAQNGVNTNVVERIANSGGSVRDAYDEASYNLGGSKEKNQNSLGEQFATGVFNRNSIIDYLVRLLRYISQIALIIGAVMFLYNGYKAASHAFTAKEYDSKEIGYAIGGILVVIFSYAIMQILRNMFL